VNAKFAFAEASSDTKVARAGMRIGCARMGWRWIPVDPNGKTKPTSGVRDLPGVDYV
jgi:hypothetical protein